MKRPKFLFLFDYDGTLTDFKKNPDHSNISAKTRALLKKLREKNPVFLVTGRNIKGLERVSKLKGFPMVGTHGFEGKNLPKGLKMASTYLQSRFRKEAARLWVALQPLTRKFPGIHIERKPFSSTLHYRGLKLSGQQVRHLHLAFNHALGKTITKYSWKTQKGKQMIEAMPSGFSKGMAVLKIMKKHPGFLPVYAGDDVTDISVFKTLGRKGLKIAIGKRIPKKFSDLRFKKPSDFLRWLEDLLDVR